MASRARGSVARLDLGATFRRQQQFPHLVVQRELARHPPQHRVVVVVHGHRAAVQRGLGELNLPQRVQGAAEQPPRDAEVRRDRRRRRREQEEGRRGGRRPPSTSLQKLLRVHRGPRAPRVEIRLLPVHAGARMPDRRLSANAAVEEHCCPMSSPPRHCNWEFAPGFFARANPPPQAARIEAHLSCRLLCATLAPARRTFFGHNAPPRPTRRSQNRCTNVGRPTSRMNVSTTTSAHEALAVDAHAVLRSGARSRRQVRRCSSPA